MSNISSIQNEQKQIERLSAQRELYSSAKRWYILQIVGSIVVPVAFVLVSMFVINVSLAAAMYGICFFIIDILIIVPMISKLKLKASKVQELFDCDVLQIPKSPLKIASDITVEEVLTYYQAHNKIKSNVEKVKDWYPCIIDNVDIEYARLICQRTNCWWDVKLRSRYISFVRGFSIIIPLLLLIVGLITSMSLETIVLLFSGLMPFFRFANKEYADQKASNDRLEKTMNYILKIWDNILYRRMDKDLLPTESRIIQDEIYEHRSKSPFILDVFYKTFRDKNEELMNKTASILVEEINSILNQNNY
jgi:hypothetical protein